VIFGSAFQPNWNLFEKHKAQGKERWEVFAWAMREVMSKECQMEKIDVRYRDTVAYWNYMSFRSAELTTE